MFLSHSLFLAAALVGVHSFSPTAPEATITPAPRSPPIEARDAVAGGPGTPILSTLTYPYTALPYQVYPFPVLRGPQTGYNQCNSSTLGPNSECQTLIFNGPDDFCLWGSDVTNGTIGDEEARVVAYCTKPYHGTRLIPPGAITGLQWTNTSAYIQVVGFINNTGIGLNANDSGGELDPHGADLQGNPLGGMVYSNGTADSDGHTLTQVHNWNTFVGGNQFCFKACYNSITSPDYCENRYDLVGCEYNMPSSVQDGEFTECDGDLQEVVGIYTSDGQTLTWTMPGTLTTTPPYTPVTPSSSNCKTYQSTDLFLAAATSSAASASGTSGSKSSGSKSGSSNPSSTGSSSAAPAMNVPITGFISVATFVLVGAVLVL
jgi:hypothetical protein